MSPEPACVPAGPGWSVWPAPAKLNLFLHVLGRRADHYHELQTCFQLLDHGDEIALRVRSDGRIQRDRPLPGIPEAADLSVRAARLLQARTGSGLGADLHVRKVLPAGGGLGGGSSNAATTLVALNALWGCGLDDDALAALGCELGADVPVFVRGRTAWAEGIGERLEPLDLPAAWYLVIDPGVSVLTGRVFQDPELTRSTPPITMSDFRAERSRNDCAAVTRRLWPEVGQALDWLGQYGVARMTGTGGCCFAAFRGAGALGQAEGALRARPAGWGGFIASGTGRSPLHQALSQYRSAVTEGSSTGA